MVFTADHGEMLFDHSLFRKVLPYEGSAHIPLIVRVGNQLRAAHGAGPDCVGQRSQSVVELMDVMPTLLELAGASVPDTVDGSSLAGEVLGGPAIERAYVHGEHARDVEQSNHYIVTPHDKYIWFSQTGREQYFDLAVDPREEHDAIADPVYADRVAELRAALVAELAGREEGFVCDGRLVPGRPLTNMLEHSA